MNSLKNRGIKDILILCADGLTGLKVRNTIKYVATKDKKIFAADLKKIYTAQDEPTAARIRDEVELKWSKKISARNEVVSSKLCK